MKVLTVKEAVERVNRGDNLDGVVLEESTIRQVNVRDAIQRRIFTTIMRTLKIMRI